MLDLLLLSIQERERLAEQTGSRRKTDIPRSRANLALLSRFEIGREYTAEEVDEEIATALEAEPTDFRVRALKHGSFPYLANDTRNGKIEPMRWDFTRGPTGNLAVRIYKSPSFLMPSNSELVSEPDKPYRG